MLALDRTTSGRTYDLDGRLRVEASRISKAAVNPYLGREIPDFATLGLDPSRTYQLLRDPDELRCAAPTFNNLPLLSQHVPVTARDHRPDLVVGATGTDARFDAPYLINSLVLWSALAIEGVESGTRAELSAAYRYRCILEPGTHEGVRFDACMTALVGNHVALVSSGRCGADVVVGDMLPLSYAARFPETVRIGVL